ncbi:Guanine nucleotide-binding protein subunit alpha-11 [Trichinella nelsoni]|uniref:Guanine nucleotide-binding protein subunit alpha-11 n=1 Tax=Trichinella nelsoni TaxID=6336 RepID=A0A0V0REX9_9BILA|nr:Guanine nucleotide-binding protein subunit alpha-11 [Trichinella nelsoni]
MLVMNINPNTRAIARWASARRKSKKSSLVDWVARCDLCTPSVRRWQLKCKKLNEMYRRRWRYGKRGDGEREGRREGDTENIRFVFAAVRDTILQHNLKEYNLSSGTKKTLTTKRKCFKNATVARRSKTKQGKAMHKAKQNFRQQQQQQQQRYQYYYYNITIRFGKTIVSKSQPLTRAFFPSMFSIMLDQEVKYDTLKCDKRPKTEGDQAGKVGGREKENTRIQYLNNFPKQQHPFLSYCSSFVISLRSFTGKYLLVKIKLNGAFVGQKIPRTANYSSNFIKLLHSYYYIEC